MERDWSILDYDPATDEMANIPDNEVEDAS